MALVYFTVTGTFKAVNSDNLDVGGEPTIQNISSLVTFTPNMAQIHESVDGVIYRLQPIVARTQIEDGQLRNIDGTPVRLVARSKFSLAGLRYHVSFDKVVYDRRERTMRDFWFNPPTADLTLDLSAAELFDPTSVPGYFDDRFKI